MLDELTSHAGDMKIPKVMPFLQTLYSIADDFQIETDKAGILSVTDNRVRLRSLTAALLMNRTELDERSQILFTAAQNASLDWLVYFSTAVYSEYEPPGASQAPAMPEKCLMTREDVDRIRPIALQRVREAAQDGSIFQSRELAYVLFRWRDMAEDSREELRKFCKSALEDDRSVVKFARAFLEQFYDGEVGDYVSRTEDRVRIDYVETLMDANRFLERLSEASRSSALDPNDKNFLRRFLDAWPEDS